MARRGLSLGAGISPYPEGVVQFLFVGEIVDRDR
jgi:hypothetical protein